MRRFFSGLTLGTVLLAGTAAHAQYRQPYGYGNNNPYGGGYGNNGGGGPYYGDGRSNRGMNEATVLDRARQDLQMAARGGYFANRHQRDHFQHALEDLDRFQGRLYEGHWDGRAIDKAIDHMSHLANDDRVRPRDRQMLANDLYQLREFRASRGYSYGRPY